MITHLLLLPGLLLLLLLLLLVSEIKSVFSAIKRKKERERPTKWTHDWILFLFSSSTFASSFLSFFFPFLQRCVCQCVYRFIDFDNFDFDSAAAEAALCSMATFQHQQQQHQLHTACKVKLIEIIYLLAVLTGQAERAKRCFFLKKTKVES